ncbi:hypothetical protein QQ020_27205 [Fulvivirgaceae bacterium BMA12]|uniref:Uncharacterized protein n=1 Tax=Agaribacillus aureus TaxID=3051825 RepID=A0ABT8LHG2_9BACT|nr:hypothetical protein [Fulvivirgaceae bacterium BMA12]
MEKSIETIWKEGFLESEALVAPKINDLYNQKSKQLIAKMKRMFKVNITAIVILSIIFPILHYFLDATWQGVAASVMLLTLAWYSKRQMKGIKTLNQGVNSYEYLKTFDQWLKNALSRNEKIIRFSYPLSLLIAMSTLWSAWNSQEELTAKIAQKFPGLIFIGNVPLALLVVAGIVTLLMFYFSGNIYRWDIRLVYGRVFDKLEETIAEMEKLRRE